MRMKSLCALSAGTTLLGLFNPANAQGCSNTCPPINFGNKVPSLCEGDYASDFADVSKTYSICHPTSGGSFNFGNFQGTGRVTVIANFYIGCNAGRRESGVYAHVAQKYYEQYGNRISFITSLKGGTTCPQWAEIYQQDAQELFPDSDVVPKEMPINVLDQEYEIRDDFFTTPFGHPSYVILDGDLKVRRKFIGPCCGYERYSDCTADIAKGLDQTLSGYLDEILAETDDDSIGELESPFTNGKTDTSSEEQPNDGSDCEVGSFTEWSSCSVACGSTPGIQFRSRVIRNLSPSSFCPYPVETRSCVAPLETCDDEGTCCIDEVGEDYTIETVASGFDGPRDVAFHPTPGLHLGSYSEGRVFDYSGREEAWVVNAMNHSVSIVSALGKETQTTISRRDRGYYHYMVNATAIAFNTVNDSSRSADRDSFNYWAVCNDNLNNYIGTKEANNFMGPTLYNSDPKNRNLVNRLGQVCGLDEECFFLHADMLHESPACIGIAHDPERTTAYGNVYWAFDSTGNQQNGQLVRFDFQQPHGPGSMDHSVAAVRRYPDVRLARGPPGVHAGMVVHPVTRELFVAVPGENKIIAVHADSGSYARTAREEYPIYSNRLPSFEYSIWECPEQRVFAIDIQMPSGLALNTQGNRLFVAERASGNILVMEVSTGAILARVTTGFKSIGGMAFSPETNTLHFVDEETNTLNAIKVQKQCSTSCSSRTSSTFEAEVQQSKETFETSDGAMPFSLYRDYSCVASPGVPDTSFFDQVHLDSGYASDDPNVQSMAGMDESAALLAGRNDCAPTSELNFDALLLGGYYCHQCLPGNHGAECDIGGHCTNVQWLGYTCDNEFVVSEGENSGELLLKTADNSPVDPMQVIFREGATYRFTIRTNSTVCISESERQQDSVLIKDRCPSSRGYNRRRTRARTAFGCASLGPILLNVTSDLSNHLSLHSQQGAVFLEMKWGFEGSDDDSNNPNMGFILGIVFGATAVAMLVVAIVYVLRRRSHSEEKEERDETTDACELGTRGEGSGSDGSST